MNGEIHNQRTVPSRLVEFIGPPTNVGAVVANTVKVLNTAVAKPSSDKAGMPFILPYAWNNMNRKMKNSMNRNASAP